MDTLDYIVDLEESILQLRRQVTDLANQLSDLTLHLENIVSHEHAEDHRHDLHSGHVLPVIHPWEVQYD